MGAKTFENLYATVKYTATGIITNLIVDVYKKNGIVMIGMSIDGSISFPDGWTRLCTLPVEVRPPQNVYKPLPYRLTNTTDRLIGLLLIGANGAVQFQPIAGASINQFVIYDLYLAKT